MSGGRRRETLALRDEAGGFVAVPWWVLSPLATETLLEAMAARDAPTDLKAEVLPLPLAREREASALLVRASSEEGLVYQRPYSAYPWCLREFAAELAWPQNGEGYVPVVSASHTAQPALYSLPPVRSEPIADLIASGSVYGSPGATCPVVLDSGPWLEIQEGLRQALPDEALYVMSGDLCLSPETREVFAHVTACRRVAAQAAPDAVAASPSDVVQAITGMSGRLLGICHSHPVARSVGRVCLTETDLATFRRNLRSAHTFSLIVNVSPNSDVEPCLLTWRNGAPKSAGFYVTGDGVRDGRIETCTARSRPSQATATRPDGTPDREAAGDDRGDQ